MMFHRSLLFVFGPVFLAASVATAQTPAAPAPAPAGSASASQPQGRVVDPPIAQESFYRIQSSDTVFVHYRYTPEYDATVMVRPDGYITLPIVGEVKLLGLTVAEAQREIQKQASVRLRDPELTMELKDFQKPRFIVGGEVGQPGQFELRGKISVLEALAIAGGLKTSAKHSQVVLFRRYDDTRAVTRVINAKELARGKGAEEVPDIRPGDFLFVPQNSLSKFERIVPFATVALLLGNIIP